MREDPGEEQLDRTDMPPRGSSRKIPLLVTWIPCGGVERIIGELAGVKCQVLSVESAEELLETTRRHDPDAVLFGGEGFGSMVGLVSRLVEVAPQTRVVVVFERPDEAELLALLHAGAAGYVPMSIPPERLCAAIDTILAGDPVVPRAMTATLVRQLRSPGCIVLSSGDNQGFELSAREWEVLCLMQQGRTTNEIAERLFVSSGTVRSHVAAIVHKLEAADRDTALAAVFAS